MKILLAVFFFIMISGCASIKNSYLEQPVGKWEEINPQGIRDMGIK